MGERISLTAKTVKVEYEVASQGLATEHPELHHYTDATGLAGIVGTNTLRATHFRDLNDTSEVTLLKTPLIEAVELRFRRRLLEAQRDSLKVRRRLQRMGSALKASRGLAEDFVEALYQTTFERGVGTPLGIAFITSFCSHSADHNYEKTNGLLSQWRGYGAGGGFAIVFDTALLIERYNSELNKQYWVHGSIGPAQYATDDTSIEHSFPDLLDRIESLIPPFIRGEENMSIADDMFPRFVAGSTRFKHQGFREEREVRIVSIPGTKELADRVRAEYPEFGTPPLKAIETAERNGRTKRFLTLFDEDPAPLPIKRVIVGPAADQRQQYERARGLVGQSVAIAISATPYIG